MKILRINSISTFTGGVETYISNIDRMLTELGHQSMVITFNAGEGLPKSDIDIEIRSTNNPMSRFFRDLIPSENLVNFLNKQYLEFSPDLIHLHHIRIGFSSLEKFLTLTRVPVVFTAHDALLVCPLSTLVKPGSEICEGGTGIRCGLTGCRIQGHLTYEILLARSIQRIYRKHIKAFLCPSYSIFNYLDNNGFRPVVHLPSFSNFPKSALEKEPNYERILEQKSIGYIGRLEHYKGIQDLLVAFKMFSGQQPEYTLKVAGIGSFETKLKELSKKLSLTEKVKWLGKIGNKELETFYDSISALVVPSNYWENFPLVAQEALLRGVPTIGTAIGGIPEIIRDSITGRVVSISSPKEIADALTDTISNKEKTLEYMHNGRNFIMNTFSPEKHINGLLKVYNNVMAKHEIPNRSEALDLPFNTLEEP